MGVKIRKEDSARIYGDHLRYKGRRSVFPPLYLSPPRASVLLHPYVYIRMCGCGICVCGMCVCGMCVRVCVVDLPV